MKKLIAKVQTYIGVLLLILGPSTSYMFAKAKDKPDHITIQAGKCTAVCRELQVACDNERRKLTLLKIILTMLACDSGTNPEYPGKTLDLLTEISRSVERWS